MVFKYFEFVNDDFKQLSDEFNHELHQQFGKKQEKYQQYNLLEGIKDVVICYDGIKPIGCASIRYFNNDAYEVKRVFTKKEYRGIGLSKVLMHKIEIIAKEKGIKKLILETGEALTSAMHLYKKIGYKIIENYGQYKNMAESICMEKYL